MFLSIKRGDSSAIVQVTVVPQKGNSRRVMHPFLGFPSLTLYIKPPKQFKNTGL